MYTEYEEKMKRLARVLKVVKRVVIVLAIIVPVLLVFFFCIGFQYRPLKCGSVVYGNKPSPKAYFTTIGETTYEYRNVGIKGSEWSEEVPVLPGEYEVRASMVSAIGVKRVSTGKFEIVPKQLNIHLEPISVYDDPHTGKVTENDYEISGLEYDDRIRNVRVQIDETDSAYRLTYHLEDLQIVHADGSDATNCYSIPSETAEIRDDRVDITIAAGTRSMMYDGDPKAFLDYDEWRIASGALKSGHTAEFHCKAVNADTWHATNRIVSGGIKDEDGNSVDYQYRIVYKDGELEMTPRRLLLTSGSAKKWYDGTPLTNPNYTIGRDGIAESDTLSAECIGWLIEPDIIPNDFGDVSIHNDRFGDVSGYYDIELQTGTLKVMLRVDEPGTDVESPYIGYGDGGEEDNRGSEGSEGEEGEMVELPGISEKKYILPGADDSTDPDAIAFDPTADSTVYVYDETASDIAIIDPTAESTIPGEGSTEDGAGGESTEDGGGGSTEDGADGESTEDGGGGSTEADGGESTKDGGEETTEGGGESTKDGGEETTEGGDETKDDSDNQSSSDSGSTKPISSYSPNFAFQSGQPKKIFSFYAFSNRFYYFKMYSYGKYTGGGFVKAEGGDAYNPWSEYLMGNAIMENGTGNRDIVRVTDLYIEHMVYPYFMTTDMEKSEDSKLFTYETYFDWDTTAHPASSDPREKEYREYVHSTYMDVPEKVRKTLEELGSEAGLYQGNAHLIEDIAEYIKNAADYSFDFNFPANEDMVIYFLTKEKKGICQHYASAATLMYRTYGIPARFVVGFAEQGTPGRWTTMTTNCGHAWVEVYVDGSGWMPVEVTGQPKYEEGSGGDPIYDPSLNQEEDEQLSITIVYDRYKKVYDGKKGEPLSLQGHLYEGRLRPGDKLDMKPIVVTDEEILERVGDYYFEVPSGAIQITDRSGHDVTDQYAIYTYDARYVVEARQLEIIVYGDYGDDTTLWRMKRMQWSISDGSLADGHTLEVYCDDKDADSGFSYTLGTIGDYKICAQILDSEGNNVTYNYDLFSEVKVEKDFIQAKDNSDKRA